jgi:hypothetical protein
MFKKKILVASLLLTGVAGLWLLQLVYLRSSDVTRYKEIIRKREIASSQSSNASQQRRKQVRKDIWFSQDQCSRLHYRISSEGSLLTLTPVKNRFEVVESLQGLKCWMQDKLMTDDLDESTSQQARLIEADSGTYCHTHQEFVANGVQISIFQLEGHQLPKEPISKDRAFLQGIAHDISFQFSGKTPQFQAKNFQATVVKE